MPLVAEKYHVMMTFGFIDATQYVLPLTYYYKNKNCLQFLLIVKAAVLKQQFYQNFIRKFNAQKLPVTFISVSGLS